MKAGVYKQNSLHKHIYHLNNCMTNITQQLQKSKVHEAQLLIHTPKVEGE